MLTRCLQLTTALIKLESQLQVSHDAQSTNQRGRSSVKVKTVPQPDPSHGCDAGCGVVYCPTPNFSYLRETSVNWLTT